MDILKTMVGWLLKFLRYVTINMVIGGLLDGLVFHPLERAVINMMGGGGDMEEQAGVGGGPGGPRGGGDGRSANEEGGCCDGPV